MYIEGMWHNDLIYQHTLKWFYLNAMKTPVEETDLQNHLDNHDSYKYLSVWSFIHNSSDLWAKSVAKYKINILLDIY